MAKAIRALSNDSGPLLDVVLDDLAEKNIVPVSAAEAGADLPEHANMLVPRFLDALLAIPVPLVSIHDEKAYIQLARTLWLFTGKADRLIRALRTSLERPTSSQRGWITTLAADAAAELGPPARDLLPALESALEDPAACPAAARALFAIDPDRAWAGADRERLVDRLIDTLTERGALRVRDRAIDILADLAPLPPASVEKLRGLASQDKRVFAAGSMAELVRTDEKTRIQVLALLSR